MALGIRLGPFRASSSGRVGAGVGPFSAYAGGRGGGGCAPLIGLMLVIGLIVVAVMWPLSLWGHAIHLTPSWSQLMDRDQDWMHRHYPLVGLRYVGAALLLLPAVAILAVPILRAADRHREERHRQAQAAYEQWLASPPPPLQAPARFTQSWIANNVPSLHPGQVPALLAELRSRGWTDEKIAMRIRPYLP